MLQIQAGQYYKLWNGMKAYIVGRGADGSWVGQYLDRDESWEETSWQDNGRWLSTGNSSPMDIISEWTEPAEVTVYVYRQANGTLVTTHSTILCDDYWTLIAKTTVREGDGL